jgi:hypothetical protein
MLFEVEVEGVDELGAGSMVDVSLYFSIILIKDFVCNCSHDKFLKLYLVNKKVWMNAEVQGLLYHRNETVLYSNSLV